MKNIGFGAYDGYASLGFGDFGSTGCGQVGELCKDRVKKEDIQELIDRINDHKSCAEKTSQNAAHPCSFHRPLKKTIEKTIDFIERLAREGNRQAAQYLTQAVDEMAQLIGLPSGGYQRLRNAGTETILDAGLETWNDAKYDELNNSAGWIEMSKYMYYSVGNRDSGGALKFVVLARDSIHFMRNITPAEDARRATTIKQLIDVGRRDAGQLGVARATLQKAWITEATRKALQTQLDDAYKGAKVKNPDASTFSLIGSAVFSMFAPEGQEDIFMEAGGQAADDIAAGDPLRSKRVQNMSWSDVYDPDTIDYGVTGDPKAAAARGRKLRGEDCFTFDVKCQYSRNKFKVWAAAIGVAGLAGLLLYGWVK